MQRTTRDPVSSLANALAHAEGLLARDPVLAERQAVEILLAVPGHPQAAYLRGAALRRQGQMEAARAVLEPLAQAQPRAGVVHLELGLVLGSLGEGSGAIKAVETALALRPGEVQAWRDLGDQLTMAGASAAADQAYARHIQASVKEPQLLAAAAALCEERLAVAEHTLRPYLKDHPTDIAALRMLAEIGSRLGRYEDAEKLLARCVGLAPSFAAARHNYATVLYRQNKAEAALEQVRVLTAAEPGNGAYKALNAAILGQIGAYDEAIACYVELLRDHPRQPKAWMSYGHALKSVGRQADSIAAYRKAIALMPALGEAHWSLANLKTFHFSDAEITLMDGQLRRSDLGEPDRYHLHFALGKALEDAGRYESSFGHYREGNALRRATIDYDPAEIHDHVARSRALFSPSFFAARAGQGCDAPDPIFIVGLPRAGSTLVEQILASHSAIEGTMELPDLITIAKGLSGKTRKDDPSAYPEVLAETGPAALKAMGEDYLARTRIHRKLQRPFFIDKMPNNFAHAGLIHLILPNAKIIDARRHPLGCCFSGFKQHFARGQNFTYDLTEIGRYYADYVGLMAHFDTVLPGRVHRVIYEDLVTDPEREVRGLLSYCGLPFEEGCLRFYENDRAVRTASSEQVRRPIFTEGLDQWRHYEPWLAPLKTALGPVLDAYPAAPALA